jgi:primosomal replication protein N
MNRIKLAGTLRSRGPLRSTPAGVAVIEFIAGHVSEQDEAGIKRRVECEIDCVAMEATAGLVNAVPLGSGLMMSGFLAARSLKNRTLVLHVKNIEFQEGNEYGF